jgi:cytochrome P450
MHLYKVVTVFGANIVASEGEEWKKYRKIGAPAFAEVCPERRSSPIPIILNIFARKIIN